ncbi:hypothetical protein [Streptomyces longispororuber]|uniref:hypothetical protein n=1 Tax=Streptomyces longispororuber TaxID=68230 RepID=UPI00210E16E7|nr:hypothetical protein [Streptomyces longispororuber]MCQ4210406.1 hypothetical protein [Streptomyces longispororuber]
MRKDPVEEALVRARFEEAQWVVRPLDDNNDTNEAGGSAEVRYRLDVWLAGARWGARAEAERQVRALTADRPDVEVEQSGLAPQDREDEATSVWHMYREPEWSGSTLRGRFARLWVAIGRADVHRTVRLVGKGSRPEAEAALKRSAVCGVPFVEGEHGARPGVGPAMDSTDADRDQWWHGRSGRVACGALGLALVVYGWSAHAVPWPWRGLLVLPLAAVAWVLGRWVTGGAQPPRLVQFGAGALAVTALAVAGYMEAGVGSRGPVGLLGTVILVPLIWLVARGTWHAWRLSRLARHAVALAPVLVLPLPWVLPFAGHFLQAGYLNDGFDIPVDAVSVDPVWTYGIAVKPVFFAACVLFVCLAMMGWARYFYWNGGGKALNVAMAITIAAVYLLTIVSTSLDHVSSVATRAAHAAVKGEDPAPYFGLDGTLVCVRPVVDRPAVENGPLPVGHRVLAFERSGDDLWLWDPEREASAGGPLPALRVRAEQVRTWVPVGSRSCGWGDGR